MEDLTSPTASNTSPAAAWPAVAVPGQGIPWRRAEQAPGTDRISTAAQETMVSSLRSRPGAEDRSGLRRPETEPQTETSGQSIHGAGHQVPDEGLGSRNAGTALGDGDGEAGRDQPPATDGSMQGTALSDDGSGTGDRSGVGDMVAGEGAELLDELRAAIGRYVVLPSDEALTAVTLWVAASHIQPALQHAPRLAVVGPIKGCGKSRVLDVLHETVHQPMMTVNTSPAVIFRIIGKNPPTLLVDDADTIFGPKAGEKEDLRGLLNAGHQRNRPAWRISGPEHKPTAFPTFAMAALAGIGDLPDTIMDRAVVIRMQKRKPGERITPFRSRYSVPELNALRDRLAAWLIPLRGTAAGLVPKMPVEDRAADTWEPLVIVADLAGGHWPAQARAACLAMTRNEVVQDEQTTLKTRLLRDIRRVFAQEGNKEALRSQDLLAALVQDAEAPWAEYGTKGLNAYHLANLLRDFGISPANHRFENGRQAKAYARNQFLDAWARYCPDPAPAVAAGHETAPARPAQCKPPAPPSGTLPVGPPGGVSGPKRTR
jgi:hypothetical protein